MRHLYRRRVQFYETDLMGVVHHSNYLRYLEEARVDWLRETGMEKYHGPEAGLVFAVVESQLRHRRPCYFGDDLEIRLQTQLQGPKLRFQYKGWTPRFEEPVVTGETLHVPLGKDLRVCRIPSELVQLLEKEEWIETWLSNS